MSSFNLLTRLARRAAPAPSTVWGAAATTAAYTTSSTSSSSSSSASSSAYTALSAAAALAAGAAFAYASPAPATAASTDTSSTAAAPPLDEGYRARTPVELAVVRKRPALPAVAGEPLFTAEEVAEHDDASDPAKGLWVTYKDGVYNVTEFTNIHPGGARFLKMAAGGAVDSWWAHWHWHHASPLVGTYLEEYRVGRLSDWDGDETEGMDMFEDDPERPDYQPALFDRPWSSQCASALLGSQYVAAGGEREEGGAGGREGSGKSGSGKRGSGKRGNENPPWHYMLCCRLHDARRTRRASKRVR